MSVPATPPIKAETLLGQPHLHRRFNLLSATALNMTNMMGAGPFITIPLLMSALGGPQAMLGWIVALVIVVSDGMVWSELGAAMPGSGGSFHYLREAFGREQFGRAMAFLFVWQFALSGPLALAWGHIGITECAGHSASASASACEIPLGVVAWREFVAATAHPESSFVVSIFMQKIYGPRVATIFTLLVLWTAFGSVFALLLGYSRIPYAAAESGYFFRIFSRLHPTKGFPYVSLLVLGAISIVAGMFSLGTVIDALIVTRILVQFMGQVFGVMLLRRRAPDMPRPYRMWLYPVPALVALLGWIFVFATTGLRVILFGVGVLALGFVA